MQIGLCNGARAIVQNLYDSTVVIKLLNPPPGITDDQAIVPVPRIHFRPDIDDQAPSRFRRIQFPISLAFSMTLHRSQGSTLEKVGLCLDPPVFSHGQLYVGLSRVGRRDKCRIYIGDPVKRFLPPGSMVNYVETDVLL